MRKAFPKSVNLLEEGKFCETNCVENSNCDIVCLKVEVFQLNGKVWYRKKIEARKKIFVHDYSSGHLTLHVDYLRIETNLQKLLDRKFK